MPNWKKLIVSGSNAVLNSVTASNGFFGTASYAVTASYALNGGGGSTFPFTGNAVITGSLLVSSSAGGTFLNTNTGYIKHPAGLEVDLANQTITGDNLVMDLLLGFVANNVGAGFVLDPFTPALFDNNSVNSVEWDGRFLYDSVGNTAMTWTNTGSSNGVRLYGTASLALTSSFLTPGTYAITSSWAVSASRALTASFLPAGTYAITASQALTASYTPNALITASVSSNVLTFTKGNGTTFNLTVATGSGGGGGSTSPGGSNDTIQFNSQSAFGGSSNLTYKYDLGSGEGGKISYSNSYDFATNNYTTKHKAALTFTNSPNGRKFNAGITTLSDRLAGGNSATTIFMFDAGGGSGGGATLKVLGFKCDYCLSLEDGGGLVTGTRTGTLLGAWDYDTNQTPTISETSNNGDISLNNLVTPTFGLVRNSTSVDLQLDVSGVDGSYFVYWTLMLTIFAQEDFT